MNSTTVLLGVLVAAVVAGMDDYISKPIHTDELVAALSRALEA
jgi:DNA-binding response OmpR family regulator